MKTLKSILLQVQETWNQSTRGQQMMLVAGGLLVILAVTGVGVWASRPVYVPIADNLSPSEAMEVVSRLEARGVEHRLSFSARQVLVPKEQVPEARIAAGDLVDTVPGRVAELQDGPFVNPELQHYQMMRQQEALLARTISQIESIDSATVHISRPDPSPFVRDRRAVTASVVLKLSRGRVFSREQAAAIVGLVNHSIEGLTPENVTLLDTSGRMLSGDGGFDADMDGQIDYRRRLEADLASKAELLLAQLLGPGRSVVRLTTDIDFKELVTEERLVDADASAKVRETVELTSGTGVVSAAAGAAGTESNLNPSQITLSAERGVPLKHERNETDFENSSTNYTTTERPGRINRLTVAAIVDLPAAAGEAGAASAITKDQVEALIKQAVGFDDQRDDQIEVVVGELTGMQALLTEDPPAGFAWPEIEGVVRNASLGLASLVMLVLGILIVRRLSPISLPQPTTSGLSEPAAQKLTELSQEARANPADVASVISEWLDGEEPPSTGRAAGLKRTVIIPPCSLLRSYSNAD